MGGWMRKGVRGKGDTRVAAEGVSVRSPSVAGLARRHLTDVATAAGFLLLLILPRVLLLPAGAGAAERAVAATAAATATATAGRRPSLLPSSSLLLLLLLLLLHALAALNTRRHDHRDSSRPLPTTTATTAILTTPHLTEIRVDHLEAVVPLEHHAQLGRPAPGVKYPGKRLSLSGSVSRRRRRQTRQPREDTQHLGPDHRGGEGCAHIMHDRSRTTIDRGRRRRWWWWWWWWCEGVYSFHEWPWVHDHRPGMGVGGGEV